MISLCFSRPLSAQISLLNFLSHPHRTRLRNTEQQRMPGPARHRSATAPDAVVTPTQGSTDNESQ